MGGSAVDTPTSRALAGAFVVTPLLSQTANGHRAGSTHPTRANPRRRQEFYESARPVSYGNATGRSTRTCATAEPHTSRIFSKQVWVLSGERHQRPAGRKARPLG